MPLKTFPNIDIKSAYGVVYWPGETITVNVNGDAGETVTNVTCTNVKTVSDVLTGTKTGNIWKFSTSATGKTAPYLEVYRVRAYAGNTEVASRGFILTLPWSGIRNADDTGFSNTGDTFMEWFQGNNPYSGMAWIGADNGKSWWGHTDPRYWPMRNRNYSWLDGYGQSDIFLFPSVNGTHTIDWTPAMLASLNSESLRTIPIGRAKNCQSLFKRCA